MQGCHSSFGGNGPVTLSEGLLKLVSEHLPLRNELEALLYLCNQVEKEDEKEVFFTQLIQEVKDFFKNLEHHSIREEEILFRMMEVYIGNNGGPIAVMEYEHNHAKQLIGEFINNTANLSQTNSNDMVKNSSLIKNAYYTLMDHFAKEEQVLFPMAERMLSQEEKEILNQKL